ncbi:alpha/beta hydrolase [Kutzneria kofuensis]|uniref:Pimeloyl-ACP methyl ester carboxylesterase n=1 Tax=Kutzneria kofuensis TaxID=103725 RepID=A0A7W9NHH4_9PSEU|nr:alpha/beta hydrolase [Kutzneria kofuensis]MBB5892745.1 pimeloyl-ACP methyl ester carboxylesterase [Kutzneria kofuensis]
MRRSFLAVALAAATGATLLAAAPAASAAGGPAAAVPAKYLAQQIAWKPCFNPVPPGLPPGSERMLCGTFAAPMDWSHPTAHQDISIAVSKLPATGPSKGSVLLNPGGPGGPGLTMPLSFLDRTKLTGAEDLIGFDVRGTGNSSNTTCNGGLDIGSTLDYRDRSPGNINLLLNSAKLTAQYCQQFGGEFGPFVNTEQTVKDLDLLRALLGRDKINWVGYSGGTWLGAYYATYFPNRVGKFVLDSNTEFTTDWQDSFDWQPLGFQRRFQQDFQPWAAKYDSTFHLGTTAEAVNQTYEQLRAKMAASPVVIGGTSYNGVALDNMIVGAMYSSSSFTALAQNFGILEAAVGGGGAFAAHARQALLPISADAFLSTFTSILCNDTPWHGNRQSLIRQSGEAGRKYPLIGYSTISQPCLSWNRPNLRMPTPTGRGVPPLLMVQDTHDPATPYEGAVLAHKGFANSRLLTVQNQGDHGIYASTGNSCVDNTVESFIVDGVVPAHDLTCDGVPLPGPGQAAPSALAKAAAYRAAAGSLPSSS